MQNKLPQGGSLGARASGCTYLMAIGSNFHGVRHLIRIQDMNSKGAFPKFVIFLKLTVLLSSFAISSNHLVQLFPQIEALNILLGINFMRIRIFTSPESLSGRIFPNTGLSITPVRFFTVSGIARSRQCTPASG